MALLALFIIFLSFSSYEIYRPGRKELMQQNFVIEWKTSNFCAVCKWKKEFICTTNIYCTKVTVWNVSHWVDSYGASDPIISLFIQYIHKYLTKPWSLPLGISYPWTLDESRCFTLFIRITTLLYLGLE